ncbi:MAG: hypothetical protein J6Q32_05585, partial [Clostridia bacterium]|nr:hypothetical protein [Clostridia bacterium]
MGIKSVLKKSKFIVGLYNFFTKYYIRTLAVFSTKACSKARYRLAYHKPLDLDNPKTLNEKLLWLLVNDYTTNPLVAKCADKYAVREYIKDCGYEEILNDLYGVYDKPSDIDWASLPNQFVLKWNFGCGYNIICLDKNELDEKQVKDKLKKWGKEKPWLFYGEKQYKYTPKKIICEKLIIQNDNEQEVNSKNWVAPEDYKVYCFNGEAKYVMVCVGREKGHPKFYFVDRNWELARINRDSINAPEGFKLEKPKCADKLFECAENLSKPFPFVRADFYIVKDKVLFGELTFSPAGSLDVSRLPQTDILMGSMLKLDKIEK